MLSQPGIARYDWPMMALPTTRRLRLLLAATVLMAAAVAGCETPAPSLEEPQLSYAHLGLIRLDVAKIDIVDEYLPPLRKPNVDHQFPISPAAALQQWAKDRLNAAGRERTARFIIRDAAVREVPLERKKGLRGLFTTDQSERYDGRVNVVLEIRSERGFRDAFVEAIAEQSRTVSEDVSLVERDRIFLKMTEELVAAMNAEIEKQIAAHLSTYRML